MKRPKLSRDAAQSPAPQKPHLLTEIHALLDRAPPPDLEDLAARLRSRAAPVSPSSTTGRQEPGGRPRALVIDAHPTAAEVTADIVTSLGHDYDLARSQTEARALLAANRYTYILLDLDIPVRKGRNHARIQHGVNLLVEIRSDAGMAGMPVVTTLAEHRGNSDIAVWMMRKGAADFIRKPFTDVGYTLEKAIADALARAKGERPTAAWPGGSNSTKKRGDRAAAIEALRDELIEHIRSARRHAFATLDHGKRPELLPRPLKKDLSRLLNLRPYTVARCFKDSRELRTLWAMAADLEQVMKFGR